MNVFPFNKTECRESLPRQTKDRDQGKLPLNHSWAGVAGLYTEALYAVKSKDQPLPVPPPTSTPPPPLLCNCTHACRSMCGNIGYTCCSGPTSCSCSPGGACPQCAPTPKGEEYNSCKGTGPTPTCPDCIQGANICSPACKPNPANPHFPICPDAPAGSSATPCE